VTFNNNKKLPNLNAIINTASGNNFSTFVRLLTFTNEFLQKNYIEKNMNPINLYQICFQVSLVVGHVHGGPAEHVGRPDEAGKADG
jgi:hypothetical protein